MRTFRRIDGKVTRTYNGFDRSPCPQQGFAAIVRIEDTIDVWTVDNTAEAVKELVRYYKEDGQVDVQINLFRHQGFVVA